MKYIVCLLMITFSAFFPALGQSTNKVTTEKMMQGNDLFRKKEYEAARKQYEQGTAASLDKNFQARAFHNIGNSYAAENDWKKAVEAYKNALKRNPGDRDTKYNLSLAQKKLKEQQQQEDQKNENKDKNEKDKNKDEKEKKEDPKKPEDKKDGPKDDKKDPKEKDDKKEAENPKEDNKKNEPSTAPSQGKLTEQRAAEMLNAIQQAEQKVQERKGEKSNAAPARLDKDW